MLGPFHEKAWDLTRQAQQQYRFFPNPTYKEEPVKYEKRQKRQSSNITMHLQNGDSIVRFAGVPEEHTEAKVQSNGVVIVPGNGTKATNDNEAIQKSTAATLNEVEIPIPEGLDANAVLDTILTAWVILVQRYQRDVFHQFTWGVENGGANQIQCIPTPDLDLQNQRAVGQLESKIRDVRSKDISVEKSIFLNDGSKEEVSFSRGIRGPCLT
ncbi:predicted protein [Plenodomus lingam JN3]|uniref:Predicted protein n=1 Tax=Leptosphaeria maculans (strain JN3 / isolate v23.1.3 / race Av1-4-5-6-7-8) TaxID=985895 RepID=E4ZJD0_LEPMJ|nr:predicted protein [Plenodomus lingam JN3]CBX91561.1 predicted protein [Plenodomus lingam JN3]